MNCWEHNIYLTANQKYLDILDPFIHLYFHKNEKINMYLLYINDKELNIKDVKVDSKGYIEFGIDEIGESAFITFLEANIQGKGIGSYLLIVVADFIDKIYNSKNNDVTINLDDMSDRARKPLNLYSKVGCVYDEADSNEPEMTCDVKKMKDYWDTFKEKYVIGKNNEIFTEKLIIKKQRSNKSLRGTIKKKGRNTLTNIIRSLTKKNTNN